MSKKRVFVALVVILTALFLPFLYRGIVNSYQSGVGAAYLNGVDRAGLAQDPFGHSAAHKEIETASVIAGTQHAIAMALSTILYFAVLILAIGYALGLSKLNGKRMIVWGVGIIGMAALLSVGAQILVGDSVNKNIKGFFGLWLISSVLYLFLIFVLRRVNRVFRSAAVSN